MKRFVSLLFLAFLGSPFFPTGAAAGNLEGIPVDVDGDGVATAGDRAVLAWWLDASGESLAAVLSEAVVKGEVIDLSAYFQSRQAAAPEALLEGGGSRKVRRFPTTYDDSEPDGESQHARITPDGRYFVFASKARKVVQNPTVSGEYFQVYRVQRLGDGSTESALASRDTSGDPSDEDCLHPSITDGGHIVVFDTLAALIGNPDGGGRIDAYARNFATSTTVLVSTESTGSVSANGASEFPSISGNGAFVVFTSNATDIDGNLGDGTHVFRSEFGVGGSGMHVSFDGSGDPVDGAATADPDLNAVGTVLDEGGDLVVYQGKPSGESIIQCWVVLPDEDPPFVDLISVSSEGSPGNARSRNPTLASGLDFAAFSSKATNFLGNDTSIEDIFLSSDIAGSAVVQYNATSGGNGDSTRAMLSSDAEVLTYTSWSSNLVTGDTNGDLDVFLADLDVDDLENPTVVSTARISVAEDGTQGDDLSQTSDVTDGGFVVVYESDATNLIDDDENDLRDIFESSLDWTRFIRADANDDGNVDISDGPYILNYLFLGGPPPDCFDAADANDDGAVNSSDPVYLFDYLYRAGSAPPAPFPDCGEDQTSDSLTCVASKCK